MRSRMITNAAVLTLSTSIMLTSGCAALRAASAKHAYINEETKVHVYEKSLDQIWPDARNMLFELGYQVRDTGEAYQKTLETEWKFDTGEKWNAKYRSRYLVQGVKVEEGKCRLLFMKSSANRDKKGNWYNEQNDRDLRTEWQMLQRLDPQKATQIESDAETKGEAARNPES